ncbi:hypothetical protein K227x_14570 [Rubripirellula lacrimiformis]|uniref:Uncharacterized protein n=1 Tax=Rubripirellula lacrimiformis TaxID=1930273 RepID=A0A517N7F8_9BACT|nr:hypothetical protein [Rubripirellula lacrimiformis]QDT03077.1 hypothetical protein K227x_14570 [Rubripirellula lacrimiformis]
MSESSEVKTFQPLGQFTLPPTPADETIRRFAGDLWRTLRRETEDPFISDDSLRVATKRKLNRIVPPPACGPLLAEMHATFDQWSRDPEPIHWMQLVVLPPCDHNHIVSTWAKQAGHTIVEAPERAVILNGSEDISLPEIEGDGVVVIPRLEDWFIRHRNGLRLLRRLLDRLAMLERHCVIGCNSWAWGYLEKIVGADLVLPVGVTLQAFDADRLFAWFTELVESGVAEGKIFRLTTTGEDIFARHSDGESANSEFLTTLAARSLGVPWVAWHLWRSSLRVAPKDNQKIAKQFPDEEALWVAQLDDFHLPKNHVSNALLALHALLLHNSLTADELSIVLPSVDESNLLVALVAAEFVERDGDAFYCSPTAYPTIRQALADAGFPLDRL